MRRVAWRFLLFQKDSALAQWYRQRTADAPSTRKTHAMVLLLARVIGVGVETADSAMAFVPPLRMGPPPRSLAADAGMRHAWRVCAGSPSVLAGGATPRWPQPLRITPWGLGPSLGVANTRGSRGRSATESRRHGRWPAFQERPSDPPGDAPRAKTWVRLCSDLLIVDRQVKPTPESV
jgi:hypothetical protein